MEELQNNYVDMVKSSDEDQEGQETSNRHPDADTSIDKEIKKLQHVMTEHGIDGVKQALRANSDKWKNTVTHIAVTGSSGAGKSAFINALRDIEAEDEGGAAVGTKETTKTLTPYKHPKNPNFTVWDMPGVGTPNFPKKSYLELVEFDKYDFFIIVSNLRFTEEDLWLSEQTQKQNKPFYFIRSNIDAAISSDKRANKKSHSTEKVLCTVKDDCNKNLMEAGIKCPKVFLVDNLDRESYEFGQLEAQLLEDSGSMKIDAMALSLSTLTKEVLQKKKEVLEDRIWDKATEIACSSSFSDRRNIFEKEISYYKAQFNLDDKTLQDNKVILKLSEENLTKFQTFVKATYGHIANELSRFTVRLSFLAYFLSRIRLVYSLGLRQSIPVLKFSCLSLKQNLDEMYKIALRVYGRDAQKSLVQSVLTSGKKSNTK